MNHSARTLEAAFSLPVRFSVHFGRELFISGEGGPLFQWLRENQPPKVLVVLDGGFDEASPESVQELLALLSSVGYPEAPVLRLPGGEACKQNDECYLAISKACLDHSICRHSCLIAMGGGALLDVAGYAAATVHRGVRLLRCPTTVLSQNDSGMGVKSGINAWGKKNFHGAFSAPDAVFCDHRWLSTLPKRERIAGMAEAVKVALLKSESQFRWLADHAEAIAEGDEQALETSIVESARSHLEHITGSGDPFEKGSSRPLDFGHWLAHRLESLSNHEIRHGEAVAIGMSCDLVYATRQGWLNEEVCSNILNTLERLNLPTHHPLLADGKAVLHGLEEFREHLGGRLTLTTLRDVADPFEIHEVDEGLMMEVMVSRSR